MLEKQVFFYSFTYVVHSSIQPTTKNNNNNADVSVNTRKTKCLYSVDVTIFYISSVRALCTWLPSNCLHKARYHKGREKTEIEYGNFYFVNSNNHPASMLGLKAAWLSMKLLKKKFVCTILLPFIEHQLSKHIRVVTK